MLSASVELSTNDRTEVKSRSKMTHNQRDQRPHFILSGYAKTEKFRSVSSGGGRPSLPPLDRATHGAAC